MLGRGIFDKETGRKPPMRRTLRVRVASRIALIKISSSHRRIPYDSFTQNDARRT